MISETKFPLADEEDYYLAGTYEQMDVDGWFKRCLTDYPNIKAILEAEPMPNMSREFQALLCVNEWRVKWFSQFTVGDKV